MAPITLEIVNSALTTPPNPAENRELKEFCEVLSRSEGFQETVMAVLSGGPERIGASVASCLFIGMRMERARHAAEAEVSDLERMFASAA